MIGVQRVAERALPAVTVEVAERGDIELDDASHTGADRQERDNFVDDAFAAEKSLDTQTLSPLPSKLEAA